MRVTYHNPVGTWKDLVGKVQYEVDHIHAVIVDETTGEEFVCHLSPEGEPMGPQVVMLERWTPDQFDSVSLDSYEMS